MKVLFVCEGNVGRSQMAAAIFNHLTNGEHEVISSGTLVIKGDDHSRVGKMLKETNNAENVLEVLAELGIDASLSPRTPVTADQVESADKIAVMAGLETVPDYLKQSPKAEFWDVEDPYMKSLERTREIRDQITDLLKTYVQKL